MPWRGRVRDIAVPRAFDARHNSQFDDDENETGRSNTKRARRDDALTRARASRGSDASSSLFAEHTFYFDGFVPGGVKRARELAERHGGAVALALGRGAGVTVHVAEDYGAMDAQARERYASGKEPETMCVRASWISACVKAGALVDCSAHAPLGTKRTSLRRGKGRKATEMDLVDLIVETAWNGTGGVSTQEKLRETWAIRVVFERVSRATADRKTKDADIRKMSAKAYGALESILDERWIIPVSACEALVDVQGTRNLWKRHEFASSQASPADVAQALEWIMVDTQGVNVDATMHNIRDDGWDPSWLRERASVDSGVMTRRASKEAAAAIAASQEASKDLQTLSQLSNIEDEVLEALDPITRYEWSKARADREKNRIDRLRAEQSAAFQLLKACGSGKVVKRATNKIQRSTPVIGRSPSKTVARAPGKASWQMPISAYASPVKESGSETVPKSCAGQPIMASASVHTATLLHALDRLISIDTNNTVEGRLDVAVDVVRLHVEELARSGRKREVQAVRNGIENKHSDHPRWLEVSTTFLSTTESLVT